jgi:murein hydrolase activator
VWALKNSKSDAGMRKQGFYTPALRSHKFASRAFLLIFTLCGYPSFVFAQSPAVQERLNEKEQREKELKTLELSTKEAQETKLRLEKELLSLREDRGKLNRALIETTARAKESEERLTGAEIRLRTLSSSEEGVRRSLNARRDVIVEVLAALQRMGRRPPPAVLVAPEDMLSSVRSAILLGAVLPELKGEAEALATDLGEMVRLRDAATFEREQVGKELVTLAQERTRLESLIDARQQIASHHEKNLQIEAARTQTLASQSKDLRELIVGIDREIAVFNRSLDNQQRFQDTLSRDVREKLAQAALKDPARLAPKVAFSDMRGLLPLPTSGTLLKPFGSPDGFGSTTRGMTYATRPQALISAPSDGWVVYAGTFRSYGRLVILNAGGGYYILVAGMERIDVTIGQFILAGEPLGAMSQTSQRVSEVIGLRGVGSINEATPENTPLTPTSPILYIEFRKDSASIDPAPWWMKAARAKS